MSVVEAEHHVELAELVQTALETFVAWFAGAHAGLAQVHLDVYRAATRKDHQMDT